jgi:hypothetical protein
MSDMALAKVKARLRAMNIALTKTDGEYRVRRIGSPPGEGYFTTCLNDAVLTAHKMYKERTRAAHVLADLTAVAQRALTPEQTGTKLALASFDDTGATSVITLPTGEQFRVTVTEMVAIDVD